MTFWAAERHVVGTNPFLNNQLTNVELDTFSTGVFKQVSSEPGKILLDNLKKQKYDEIPDELVCVPTDALINLYRESDYDFRDSLERSDVETMLYTVKDKQGTVIGTLTQASPWIANPFGDQQLHFYHNQLQDRNVVINHSSPWMQLSANVRFNPVVTMILNYTLSPLLDKTGEITDNILTGMLNYIDSIYDESTSSTEKLSLLITKKILQSSLGLFYTKASFALRPDTFIFNNTKSYRDWVSEWTDPVKYVNQDESTSFKDYVNQVGLPAIFHYNIPASQLPIYLKYKFNKAKFFTQFVSGNAPELFDVINKNTQDNDPDLIRIGTKMNTFANLYFKYPQIIGFLLKIPPMLVPKLNSDSLTYYFKDMGITNELHKSMLTTDINGNSPLHPPMSQTRDTDIRYAPHFILALVSMVVTIVVITSVLVDM